MFLSYIVNVRGVEKEWIGGIMKKYKTVKETREKQELTNIVCDICGYDNEHYYDWQNDPNKEGSSYFDTEVEIRYRYGVSYPEGGSGYEYNLDICPKCFMEKIVPLLKTNKEPREWSW